MLTSAVESALPAESIVTLAAAGLTPSDVINWIKSHGYLGAELLRKFLPLLGLDPKIMTVIMLILDMLYPVQPTV